MFFRVGQSIYQIQKPTLRQLNCNYKRQKDSFTEVKLT